MNDKRAFPNKIADWNPELNYNFDVEPHIQRFLNQLEDHQDELDPRDTSVYTGIAGISLLYYHLYRKYKKQEYLSKAKKYIDTCLKRPELRSVTFLCGAPGTLAIAAVIYNWLEDHERSKELITSLEEWSQSVLAEDASVPDELLYGRVGYLYALLFIKANNIQHNFDPLISQVVKSVLKSGQMLSSTESYKKWPPLMYMWHDQYYVGAAHGLCGILYILMEVKQFMQEQELFELIKPSVDYVMALQFPSGNFPSSVGNDNDKLIHWCHGAPGVIHMLLKAHQVFGDDLYMKSAQKAAQIIWDRGLLKKGFGLCHGVAGNAYGMLHLYQTTKEQKYLYRVLKFAEWCAHTDPRICKTPDRPLSLLEGLAGTIYFLADLTDPDEAKFPAFQC